MKQYGIRITLTEENPLRAEHLLGSDWEAWHWYDSQSDREKALTDIERHLPNYRDGDFAAQVATRVEREAASQQ